MNRTERLLDLITYLLNAEKPVSWQQIKNHFAEDYARGVEESNQRKFERDKAELISLGIPIDYESGSETRKEGYIIRKETLFLAEMKFSPEESSLLMLSAGAVLENNSFPYREELQSALNKIISVQHPVGAPPETIAISYSTRGRSGSRAEWVHRIQKALRRRKTIEIEYHAFSTGETTRRKVDPYGLIFRKGNWMMVGWDHLRKDLRSFVMTRIRRLSINTRKPGTPDYTIPADFSLKRYQNQQPWELDLHTEIPVTLRVSTHRLPELLPQLSAAQQTGEHTFRLKVTNENGLISWALSHRTDVQILEPPDIQARVCEVLQRLL